MRAPIATSSCIPNWCAAFLCAPALCVLLFAAPAGAAKSGAAPQSAQSDCQHMQELYRACHKLGQQTDSLRTCQEAAQDLPQRAEARSASKNPQAARALAELVCTTGCEDALAGQPPATPQEFAEAFCESAPKNQGARP